MNERKATIQKIIRVILEDLEEKDKGNLTSIYAIRLLQEAISDIEATALMRPVRHAITDTLASSAKTDDSHAEKKRALTRELAKGLITDLVDEDITHKQALETLSMCQSILLGNLYVDADRETVKLRDALSGY